MLAPASSTSGMRVSLGSTSGMRALPGTTAPAAPRHRAAAVSTRALGNAKQQAAFDAVAAALPFPLDTSKVTVVPGVDYVKSAVKAHDYAAGVMAAFGCAVEHLGVVRGLPEQTLALDRRRCGLLLNSMQLLFQNGHTTLMDKWGVNPDNGTYETKDGRHVTMIGLHPHLRDRLLAHLGGPDGQSAPNTVKGIAAGVARYTAEELEADAVTNLLPLGIVRTPEEWAAHPIGAQVSALPMIDFEATGEAQRRRLGKAKHRPLEGVRVVELTHVVAGPHSARLLAEQGADVIKVQPPVSDWVLPIWYDGSWGKKNVTLDIKGRRGRARFLELIASADVLIDGQRPGVLNKMGLDNAFLRELNPNLVRASLSCFPLATAWAERPGFEQVAQAVSGVSYLHSKGMASPTVVPALINDYLTAYLVATGAVAALAQREQKGGYYHVASSLSRCSTLAATLYDPQDSEPCTPVTMKDLVVHGIDQPSPVGIWTRIAPAVEFSVTPSHTPLYPTLMNSSAPSTGWDPVPTAAPVVPHYPSRLAAAGEIPGLIECHGIEDRSDGGGVVSLASKSLFEYIMAHRND